MKMSVYICLALAFFSCAGLGVLNENKLTSTFDSARKKLGGNSAELANIAQYKLGASGYFYVISTGGVLIAHPQRVLNGSNFSRYPFIMKIIEKKSGCMRYQAGDREMLVLFAPLNDLEILCFAIDPSELEGMPGNCAAEKL